MLPTDTLIRGGDLSLRRMRRTPGDLALLLSWRQQPHVRAFWDNDDDLAGITMDLIEQHYAPLTDPSQPAVGVFIELAGAPVGYLQVYPWSEDLEGALATSIPMDGEPYGLDIFIGDPACTGRGVGTRAVDLACRYVFESRGATRVALVTELGNVGAQRAYAKAGFTRVRQVLDTDTRGGQRIPAWLMVRERPR